MVGFWYWHQINASTEWIHFRLYFCRAVIETNSSNKDAAGWNKVRWRVTLINKYDFCLTSEWLNHFPRHMRLFSFVKLTVSDTYRLSGCHAGHWALVLMTVITSSPCRGKKGKKREGGGYNYKKQFVAKWMTIKGEKKEHWQRKGQNWQIDISESERSLQGQ